MRSSIPEVGRKRSEARVMWPSPATKSATEQMAQLPLTFAGRMSTNPAIHPRQPAASGRAPIASGYSAHRRFAATRRPNSTAARAANAKADGSGTTATFVTNVLESISTLGLNNSRTLVMLAVGDVTPR